MNFKNGDKAIIKARKYGHYFKLKEEVTIVAVHEKDQNYEAKKGSTIWYVKDDELKSVSKENIDLHQKGLAYDKLKKRNDELVEIITEIENNFSKNSDMYSFGYMHKKIKQALKNNSK